jgi:hypothetical protein
MIRTRALADLLRRRRRRLMTHFCLSIFRLRFLVCFQCRIGGARPMNGMVNSANQRALLRPILALISQPLSALDVVQRHHLKPSPAGDPICRREAAPPRLRQV